MHRDSSIPMTQAYLQAIGPIGPDGKRKRGGQVDPVLPRIHANTERNEFGCWLWTGTRMANGYGTMAIEGRSALVHRVAYTLLVGDPGDLHICHHCDIHYPPGDFTYRRCCNPDHLLAATNLENHQHAAQSGRGARGERQHAVTGEACHSARFTPEIVREIRAFTPQNYATSITVGQRYGVSHTAIRKIWQHKTWRHVE